MEPSLPLCQFASEISTLSSPLAYRYRLPPLQNAPARVSFAMRYSTRIRLSPNICTKTSNFTIFQYPKFLSGGVDCLKTMATTANRPRESTVDESKKKEGEEKGIMKELPPPPPPPEKPEPGDCCGSGCVRCVWDVYYEELEAYNKLLKADSESKAS